MATTATNKQPLLVDHVLHEVVDLAGAVVIQNGGVSINGGNSAKLIIDSTTADGCIIEDIYSISRGEAYKIKLFLSTSNDYLRTNQGVFVGSFTSDATEGNFSIYQNMPHILAPVPAAGTVSQLQAFYIPKGKALWAAVEELSAADEATDAPLLGVQGGWY